MEFIIILVVLTLIDIFLKIVFCVKIKKLKQFEKDEYLDKVVSKYPENTQICEEILKKVNNNTVKIEEDPNADTTLYLVMSNKIFIANLNKSYTRIQTIAHECLHSIQDKKILWSNFLFSNIYLIYFFAVLITAIFGKLPNQMACITTLAILGIVYLIIRMYLENDAMIKARYLAKEYMEEKEISTKEEIEKMIQQYDIVNDLGIKCVHYQLALNVLAKIAIVSLVCFWR